MLLPASQPPASLSPSPEGRGEILAQVNQKGGCGWPGVFGRAGTMRCDRRKELAPGVSPVTPPDSTRRAPCPGASHTPDMGKQLAVWWGSELMERHSGWWHGCS